jgi:hypothetical protein
MTLPDVPVRQQGRFMRLAKFIKKFSEFRPFGFHFWKLNQKPVCKQFSGFAWIYSDNKIRFQDDGPVLQKWMIYLMDKGAEASVFDRNVACRLKPSRPLALLLCPMHDDGQNLHFR